MERASSAIDSPLLTSVLSASAYRGDNRVCGLYWRHRRASAPSLAAPSSPLVSSTRIRWCIISQEVNCEAVRGSQSPESSFGASSRTFSACDTSIPAMLVFFALDRVSVPADPEERELQGHRGHGELRVENTSSLSFLC